MIRLPMVLLLALLTVVIKGQEPDGGFGGVILEDHTGAPLASALVRLSRLDAGILKETETNRDGRFDLGRLAAGEYQLSATKTNYVSLTARFSPTLPVSPVLRLVKYGSISGGVSGASGGVVVVYEHVPAGRIPRIYRGTLDNSGEYRVFGIPPGRYSLGMLNLNTGSGMQRGQTLDRREFVFTGGEDYTRVNLNAPQSPAVAIGGRVENAQTHSILLASPEYPAIQFQIMLSRADGTFRFDNILAGRYDLLASSMPGPDGAALHGRVQVDVYGQVVENLVIPLRRTPSVEFALDETLCAAEATLTLTPLDRVLGGRAVVVPIAAGKPLAVDGLAPTQYEVATATREDTCLGTPVATIDLTRTAPASPVAIRLHPPGSLRGKVEGAAGQTIATVVLRDMSPARESAVQVLFIPAGAAFNFENLPPGTYCVTATTGGGRGDCESSSLVLAPGESKAISVPIAAQ
jgi:hypothetical protein